MNILMLIMALKNIPAAKENMNTAGNYLNLRFDKNITKIRIPK